MLGDYVPSTCDFAEPPSDTHDVTLYLSTFWDDPKERDALSNLLAGEVYRYDQTRKDTRVKAQLQLNAAFKNEKLPDVFQANGGSDVLRWVGGGGDASAVCPLDRLAESNGWQNAYFTQSLRPVSCRGSLYALPVGIHRLNMLFYNHELFQELKRRAEALGQVLVEPADLGGVEELLTQLEQVRALSDEPEAPEFVPLAFGAKRAWPLTVMAFENVLLSVSKDAYRTLWQGGLRERDDRRAAHLTSSLEGMLNVLSRLIAFSQLDERVDWQDAVRQVGRGEALFTVTGDWGWAQLEDDQVGHVSAVPFPGTASTFVYTPDSFAVPRELQQNGSRARGFLQNVVANKDALLAFSASKHSIPARRDFQPEELGPPELAKTYRQFSECDAGVGGCELLLATSGLAPPPGFEPCFDDIEALLSKAVTDNIPKTFDENPRDCPNQPWPPKSRAAAAERMVTQLLEVASQQVAPDCR